MKKKHNNTDKVKKHKTNKKKIKAKLPDYKATRNELISHSKNPLSKNTSTDTGDKRDDDNNGNKNTCEKFTSGKEDLLLRSILKRNKKKLKKFKKKHATKNQQVDIEIAHSSHQSAQDSVNIIPTSNEVSNKKEFKSISMDHREDKTNQSYSNTREISTLMEDLSSLHIPDILKYSKEEQKVFDGTSFKEDLHSTEKDACVIIAESINPNDSLNSQENNEPTPKKNSRKKKYSNSTACVNSDASVNNQSLHAQNLYDIHTENVENQDNVPKTTESELSCTEMQSSERRMDSLMLQFYTIGNNVLVIMKNGSKFCFAGKLVIKVLYGAIEVHGLITSKLNSPINAYSPRGYSFVTIETSDKYPPCSTDDVWSVLTTVGITPDVKKQLQEKLNECIPGCAVILLRNLENNLTRFLNIFYPFKLFPEIKDPKNYSWTDSRRAEFVLQTNFYFDEQSCKRLIVDPCLSTEIKEKIIDQWKADDWCCTLIAGGKSVGKSTAVRSLINTLLPTVKQIVLLDLDIGQAECTPPGCISYSIIEEPLIGPNFTHLSTPVYQLYIGDVNVTRCLTEYFKGVKLLIDTLLKCPISSRLPIIVNTMGFPDGIGWDIAMYVIKVIRPSTILQIVSEKPRNNFCNYLSSTTVNQQKSTWVPWTPCKNIIADVQCKHELYVLPTQAELKCGTINDMWNMEPYQKRELVMISYLSKIINYNSDLLSLTYYINEAIPYMAPFNSLNIALPQSSVPPSHVLNVINGNIVALCGIDVPEHVLESSRDSLYPRVLSTLPLCTCYGFGIIRGVDMEKREIFINTPLPASTMEHVNCLVGCIPVPQTLLQLNQPGTPYANGINTLPTSREPRRGYFRMRHQNRQTSS